MPKKTLAAVVEADKAKKQALAAHDKARNQLLSVVKRVLLEVYQEVPGFSEKLNINGGQTLLGQDFVVVVKAIQDITGVKIDPQEAVKLTATSIALDIASALNNEGTEVEYEPNSKMGVILQQASEKSGVPVEQMHPWTQIGTLGLTQVFGDLHAVMVAEVIVNDGTTINEIALGLVQATGV